MLFWPADLINHPDGVKQVLQENRQNYHKDLYPYRILKPFLGQGLVTNDGEFWHHQRRLRQPAFHWKRLAAFGTLMADATVSMFDQWQRFADLSASSASDIWAIGNGSNGEGSGPLFAHFNGTSWQQITGSTDVQFFNNSYTTIAAHSSTDALAVGFNSITGKPAVDQWDGKSWNPVSFALPAGENLFNGNHGEGATFTTGGDAWIVGGALTSTQTTTTEQTFTAHCRS